jgi:hypothetical protein
MEIMSFHERSLSLSSGEQVRGRVIAPLCSVALSYTSYKKILSLPRLLTEADTPLFLGGKTGYSSTYVLRVHIERSEKHRRTPVQSYKGLRYLGSG